VEQLLKKIMPLLKKIMALFIGLQQELAIVTDQLQINYSMSINALLNLDEEE